MDIQFFNTNKLTAQLANNEVSEKATFSYFLANTILWTLILYYGPATGAKVTWLTLYDLVLVLIVSIIGLLKCFEANGGADGKSFLVRATCLSFPIGLKINILYLLLVWGTYYVFPKIIDGATFRDPARVYMLLMFLISAITAILFYRRLWVHISYISRQNAPNQSLNLTGAKDAPPS